MNAQPVDILRGLTSVTSQEKRGEVGEPPMLEHEATPSQATEADALIASRAVEGVQTNFAQSYTAHSIERAGITKRQARRTIIGMLLGDARVVIQKTTVTLSIKVSTKDTGYAYFKKCLIELATGKPCNIYYQRYYHKQRKKWYEHLQLMSNSKKMYKLYRKLFYDQSRKRITQRILNLLTDISLALWYMDDGSLEVQKDQKGGNGFQARRIGIHTECFTMKEQLLIQNHLKNKFGLETKIITKKSGPQKGQHFLRMNTKNTRKFITRVWPFVTLVPCMKRKYDLKYSCTRTTSFGESNIRFTLPAEAGKS